MNWGGPSGLRTKIGEGSFNATAETLSTPAQNPEDIVTHLFVAKLNAATETVPSCLTKCTDTTATATVEATSCFIDGVCYADGDTAEAFGKSCHICNASTSQTEWSAGPTVGTSHCFIDDICWADGDYLFTQRGTRSPKKYSSCKHCSPAADATAWSIAAGFEVVDDTCVSIAPSPPPHAGTFTDDEGTTHTWGATVPKIVVGAFDAITLMHFGMQASQIVGTFGQRGTSGSNLNSYYHDGNNADHGNHSASVYDALNFPTDPNALEQAMLAQALDLSADCSATNYYCASFDHTILDANGWPDLIIQGSFHGPSPLNAAAVAAAAARGIPIIKLTRQYNSENVLVIIGLTLTLPLSLTLPLNPNPNPNQVSPKGFIEIAHRFEDLARALGVSGVTEAIASDKAALCAEVEAFKPVARGAQTRGVRAMAAYLPYGEAAANGDIGGFAMSPDKDPVLMMLEVSIGGTLTLILSLPIK